MTRWSLGLAKRPEVKENERLSAIDYRINRRPSSLPAVSDWSVDWDRFIERRKSSVRSKVEYIFRLVKCQFGFRKTVYRGLHKNANRLFVLLLSANLYTMARAGRTLC